MQGWQKKKKTSAILESEMMNLCYEFHISLFKPRKEEIHTNFKKIVAVKDAVKLTTLICSFIIFL